MAVITFEYENIPKKLVIETGANQISWSYNLNTQAYPTYGGEVVQILSTYIDTLTIVGDVPSYAKMEEIYRWFLRYLQDATQGYKGNPGYSEKYVVMKYPVRGWELKIQPTSLPGLRYGRDVVVPQWRMEAHVVDPDPEQKELTIQAATNPEKGEFINELTADIGFRDANPFSDPQGILTKEEAELFPDAVAANKKGGKLQVQGEQALDSLSARLNQVLGEFTQGNFSGAMEALGIDVASKPTDFPSPYQGSEQSTTNSAPPSGAEQATDGSGASGGIPAAAAAVMAAVAGLRYNSGYRTPEHNREVGGVEGSWHTKGNANQPGAVDLGGSEVAMANGLTWAQTNIAGLDEAMIHDVGSGRHLHLGGPGILNFSNG